MKQLLYITIITLTIAGCSSRSQTVTTAHAPACVSDSLAHIIKIDTAYTGNICDQLKFCLLYTSPSPRD